MTERRVKDECFGLPYGGAIFGLFIGVIIILAGIIFLLQRMGWEIADLEALWPYAVIVFGILFIAGALYRLTHR